MVCPDGKTKTVEISGYHYTDPHNTIHAFSNIIVDTQGCLDGTTAAGFADDNSGFYISVDASRCGVFGICALWDKFGNSIDPFGNSITDPNGYKLLKGTPGNGTYTYNDPLSATPILTWAFGNSQKGDGSPEVYTYTDAAGRTQTVQVNYTQVSQQVAWGCGWDWPQASPAYFPTSVVLADTTQYVFTYETSPVNPNAVTGRIASVQLPTGATITYTYSGGTHGMDCSHIGWTPTLTRKLTNTDNSVAIWTYTSGFSGQYPQNTVVDAMGNETDYNFVVYYETQRVVYTGSGTGKQLLMSKVTCYGGNLSNCVQPPNGIQSPITQVDTFTTPAGSSSSAHVQTTFDQYKNVTETKVYDYGASSPTTDRIISYGSYSNGQCTPVGPGPYYQTRICSDVSKLNGSTLSQTNTTYDSKGNPKTISQVVGSSTLTRTNTFNTNGTLNIAKDINGTQYTYTYDANVCNSNLPTGVTATGSGVNLSRAMTWDCNGAVMTALTDNNNNLTSSYKYTKTVGSQLVGDPFYRMLSMVDTGGYTTNYTYTGQTAFESSKLFNANQSIEDVYTTYDGFGRKLLTQVLQGPNSSTWDTVSYAYDADGRLASTSIPCAASKGSGCSTPVTTYAYDGLNRLSNVTDGGRGTVSYTPNANDVLVTVGPAPTNENAKSKNLEYDGLGRLKSVCEITLATGYVTCGQTNSYNGYWTKYIYDTTTINQVVYARTTVTQNMLGNPTQTRTLLYDGAGRLVSESNPEMNGNSITYGYDAACSPYLASAGDMTSRIDTAGHKTCYAYDGLHRLTDAGLNGPTCHHLRYDANVNPPNGVTVPNKYGELVEAFTDNCNSTRLADEWFGYDALGRNSDFYQSTTHYPNFTHLSATFAANGSLQSLSGIPSQSGWTFGLDGEGRPNSAASGTTNWVSSVTYPLIDTAHPNQLTISYSNGDSDLQTLDPNTWRPKTHTASVGSGNTTVQEVLGWNASGSLAQQQIVNGFHPSMNQTCKYLYDDLGRIGLMPGLSPPQYNAVDCGASSWQQNFTYDPFGNITKTGSQQWIPGYDSSTNHYVAGTGSYDANGNLTTDPFHTYSWDPNFGSVSSVDNINVTYDGLNRMSEQAEPSGAYNEILYSPLGKLGVLNGTVPVYAAVPLPGGSVAWVPGPSAEPKSIEHKDWLGSTRLLSSLTQRADYFDTAYAPFGENYFTSGMFGLNFTGQSQDTSPGLYDFLYREYHPVQGRWISPDPAGIGAVDFTNPQSLNRYAYVSNMPLNNVDPQGLRGNGLLDRCPDGPDIDAHCNSYIQWNWSLPGFGGGGAPFGYPITDFQFYYQENFLPGDQVFVPKPLSPAAIQAIVAAISGDWRGLLDAGLAPIEQEMWSQALNPIMDAESANTKQSRDQCFMDNMKKFSLAGIVDNILGTNMSDTFAGNLALGNDITGLASALTPVDPTGSMASVAGQSFENGVKSGIGTPLRIGGNTAPAFQTLFPRHGRPAQALLRAKGLSKATKLFDILDGKLAVDATLTMAWEFSCPWW